MQDRTSKNLCVCAAVFGSILAVGVATAPAWAQRNPELVVTGEPVPIRVVHVADLNLRSEAGLHTLKWRVRGAVRSLCGTHTMELAHNQWVRGCARTANDSANEQISELLEIVRYASRDIAPTQIRIAARK